MSAYLTSSADLASVANAIRAKRGFSGSIAYPDDYVAYVCNTIKDPVLLSVLAGTIVSITDSEITRLGTGGTFKYCSMLEYAAFPNCEYIQDETFYQCTMLQSVSFPKCSYIGNYTFEYCYKLSQVVFPECTEICQGAFQYCSGLNMASFPKCEVIKSYAFSWCRSLYSLYLMGSTPATLSYSREFDYSPLSSGGSGTIYVPASLLATYRSMENWSNYSARFSGV